MRRLGLAWLLVVVASTALAQSAAPPKDAAEPPIRRWIDVQNWTLFTRYRFIENSSHVTTADQWQYKDTLRARFNVDAQKRFTINAGFFTGTNFIGTWDNTGLGTGDRQTQHFVKQLYVSAIPLAGLEVQYGGLYVIRGENTEITSYDDDGYLMGERVTLRHSRQLFFDEISATRGLIGPFAYPAVTDRWKGLHEANYGQVLVAKRIGSHVRASADYTNQQHQAGNDTLRAGIAVSFPKRAPLDAVRWEQYYRFTGRTGAGFAALADRQFGKVARLQAGYVTIDEFYIGYPADRSGWNADRIQRGRRLVFYGTVPVWHELSVAPYYTHAFDSPFTVTLKNRFDFVIQYDLLRALQRAGSL